MISLEKTMLSIDFPMDFPISQKSPVAVPRLDAPTTTQLQAAGFGQLLPGPHAGAHDQQRGAQDLLGRRRSFLVAMFFGFHGNLC